MSVREEDRQNKNCPSRGLGLAAAAIGVGVGAALYYFFSKRPENPHEEGSTSNWECEQAQTLTEDETEDAREEYLSDNSYITVSENTTTDTSMHTSQLCGYCNIDSQSSHDEEPQYISDDDEVQLNDSLVSEHIDLESEISVSSDSDSESSSISSEYEETAAMDDSDDVDELVTDADWDMYHTASDVPTGIMGNNYHLFNMLTRFQAFVSPRNRRHGRGRLTEEEQMERARALSEEEQLKFLRDQAFRERSWSLEECSICFEVILKNQEVMSLPCTHHFHTACILPWLQEQQTCPNCRKAAE